MTPGAVRPVHPGRDRALDRAGQGAQDPGRRVNERRCHGPQHPGRRRPQRPADHADRSRASSPRTRRAAGATRSITKRIARSSTGWAARSAPPRTRRCDAALAAVQMLQPAPQATRARPPRAGGHGRRRAAQRHQLAHLRLRRHAPEDHHPPGRPGGLGGARAGRAPGRQRPRADRRAGARHRRVVPHRQRDVPRALRPRLAHHRLHRHARRRRGLRAPAVARRAADRDGAGHRGVAAGRACASSSAP